MLTATSVTSQKKRVNLKVSVIVFGLTRNKYAKVDCRVNAY